MLASQSADNPNYNSNLGFTGEQTDDNGLSYLRARYYNPELGTFLSRDHVEGVADRFMSRNGYSYAEANPVNYTDPSGQCLFCVLLAVPLIMGTLFAANDVRGQVYYNQMNGHPDFLDALGKTDLNQTRDSFLRGAVFAGGAEMAVISAVLMPGAALAYLGATAAYTIAGNNLGVSGWGYDAIGILTGMGFIRNDYNFITSSNASWEEKLQAVGDIGFNVMLGSSLFSGLSKAGRAFGLSRRLAAVTGETLEDVAAGRMNVLLDEAKRMTGMEYSIQVSEESSRFFRRMGTTTIEMSGEALTSSNMSGLAGNFLHEVTHGMQEFGRTGMFMRPFLDLSANTLPFSGSVINRLGQFARSPLGYFFNPVEFAAGTSGMLTRSLNSTFLIGARLAQITSHDHQWAATLRHTVGLQ